MKLAHLRLLHDGAPTALRKSNCHSRQTILVALLFLGVMISVPSIAKAEPVVSGFSPVSGSAGNEVVINGSGFGALPEHNTVTIAGTLCHVVEASPLRLKIVIPRDTQTGKIRVQTTTGWGESWVSFIVAPLINNLSPDRGPPGSPVQVRGRNFNPTVAGNQISFNGVNAAISTASRVQLNTTVPLGSSRGDIAVVNDTRRGSSDWPFDVILSTPKIDGFEPGTGIVGSQVTLSGNNFATSILANQVSLNGLPVTITAVGAKSLSFIVPEGASTGPITIAVAGDTSTTNNDFHVAQEGSLLIPDGPTVIASTATAGEYAELTFNALAGDELGLGFSALIRQPTNSSGVPFVAVFRPDDTVLQSIYCLDSCAMDLASIPVSGIYTVKLFPNDPEANLDALVALTRASTMSISAAVDVELKLDRIGQIVKLQFSGVAGQSKAVELYSAPGVGYSRNDSAEVRQPNNALVNSEGAAVSCIGCSALTMLNLPFTGDYNLIVKKGTGGNRELIIRLVEPKPIEIDGRYLADEVIFPHRTKLFHFPVVAGQRLDLGIIVPLFANFSTSTFRPNKVKVSIFDSVGNAIHQMPLCSSLTGSFSQSSYVEAGCGFAITNVVVTGDYIVVVRPLDSLSGVIEPTHFVAYVSTPNTVSAPIDGPKATLNLNRPGQAGLVMFDGIAGQDLQFDGGSRYDETIYSPLKAYKPDGSEWMQLPVANSNGLIDLPTLPATGTYVLEEGTLARKIVDRQMSLPVTIRTLQSCGDRARAVPTFISVSSVIPSQVIVDGSFVVSADVTPSNGACGVAQGTVTVSVQGASNFCTYSTPAESGCALTAAQSGTRSLILTFTPTDPEIFSASVSYVANAVTVLRRLANVEIISVSPTPSELGQQISTLVEVVSAAGMSPIPSGVVEVRANTGTSCSFYLPAANCAMSIFTAGVSSVTATYYGDSSYEGVVSSAVLHTVLPSPPTITGFTPVAGLVGSSVTITGTDFDPLVANNLVRFNGASAFVSSATATTIVANVPNGATTGPIVVVVNGRPASTSANFVVTSPPPTTVVSGLMPTSGVTGIPVKISGSGFSAGNVNENQVRFNGAVAQVTQASSTQLTAIVPGGATSGPVSVSVAGVVGTSGSPFSVLPRGVGLVAVAIESIVGEPSIEGQLFTVHVAVAPSSPTGPTPTGAVFVSDGVHGCMVTLPETGCATSQHEPGEVLLFAWYTGDQNYGPAYSPYFPHITNPVIPGEICGFDPRTVPNDPPGFVPMTQLSGIVYGAGQTHNIIGSGSLGVTIDSPINGSTVFGDLVDVVGTFNGPVNTGITVNGIAAKTVAGRFMVPNVPLKSGANTLDIVATTLPGLTATASISLNRGGTAPLISFRAEQPTGIAPTQITFNVVLAQSLSGANLQRIRIDTNGDGVFDRTSTSLEELPLTYQYALPGLFNVTLEVTTISGQVNTATQWVLIRSAAAERGMLCDIYGYLKARLVAQDATGAAAAYDPSSRPRYFAAYTALGQSMPSAATQLGTVASGFIGPRYAQILVLRENADQTRSGYHVQMIQGSDGVWRIESM